MIILNSDSFDLSYEVVALPICHKQLHLLCIQVHGHGWKCGQRESRTSDWVSWMYDEIGTRSDVR